MIGSSGQWAQLTATRERRYDDRRAHNGRQYNRQAEIFLWVRIYVECKWHGIVVGTSP